MPFSERRVPGDETAPSTGNKSATSASASTTRCEENFDCETHCANDETLKQMPEPHRRRRVRKNVQPGKPLLENNIADRDKPFP